MARGSRATVAGTLGRAIVVAAGGGIVVCCLLGCEEDEIQRLRALNNHAKHVALNMDCVACHTGARDEVYARLPSIRMCGRCHRPDQSDPPTPPVLAEYIEAGREIPWIRVNRLPGHVYFSHVAHVKYGAIKCGQCHGDMTDTAHPAERPLVRPPDMFACIDCHQKHNASVDCLACHK